MPDESLVHVIDDDDAVRDSLEFLLTAAGIEVRTYVSAKAFLDTLETASQAASSPTCACRR
jgi:two-component system, LuxR family, response regulator FixJ